MKDFSKATVSELAGYLLDLKGPAPGTIDAGTSEAFLMTSAQWYGEDDTILSGMALLHKIQKGQMQLSRTEQEALKRFHRALGDFRKGDSEMADEAQSIALSPDEEAAAAAEHPDDTARWKRKVYSGNVAQVEFFDQAIAIVEALGKKLGMQLGRGRGRGNK